MARSRAMSSTMWRVSRTAGPAPERVPPLALAGTGAPGLPQPGILNPKVERPVSAVTMIPQSRSCGRDAPPARRPRRWGVEPPVGQRFKLEELGLRLATEGRPQDRLPGIAVVSCGYAKIRSQSRIMIMLNGPARDRGLAF
jgi:hypothetical protein